MICHSQFPANSLQYQDEVYTITVADNKYQDEVLDTEKRKTEV